MLVRNPNIKQEILAALTLCTNLRSMTWIDDSHTADASLLKFLAIVRKFPLRELTIRTHGDPSNEVWSQLMSIVGLEKVSLCCTEVPSRVLHGWSESLGSTLTHLELSVCISPSCKARLSMIYCLSKRDVPMLQQPLFRFFNGYPSPASTPKRRSCKYNSAHTCPPPRSTIPRH
jgi:hypothetical protein